MLKWLGRLRKRKHPYPEQFSKYIDMPAVEWARSFMMIASTPRCGSHFLGHMLGETGEYGVPLEYLHPGNTSEWKKRFGTQNLTELFPHFVRHRTTENGVFCFKAHWRQFEPHAGTIETLTRQPLDRIVWIARRDQLSQVVSLTIAQQTRAWISGAPEQRPASFDYDQIARAAESIRHWNMEWKRYLERQTHCPYHLAVFEEIRDSGNVRDGLKSYLGGTRLLTPPTRVKKQSGTRNDHWKERFRAELRTEHGWILDAPEWLQPAA